MRIGLTQYKVAGRSDRKVVDMTKRVRSNRDEKVAVDGAAQPGYLGAASDDGVLRTNSTLTYTDGGDHVTLGVKSTTGTGGSSPGEGLPEGNYEGQVMWWDEYEQKWMLSKEEAVTGPAVLVYDTDGGDGNKVRWVTLSADYRGIFRSGDDAISDVPRVV